MTSMRRLAQRAVLAGIAAYQAARWTGLPCCRFVPSCSAYAREAVERYGAGQGLFYAVRRLLKCHPFHSGGVDPVH